MYYVPCGSVSARKLGWTYVSVVYSDSEYGRHGWEMLSSLAANYSVCFSSPLHRVDKNQDFTDEEATSIVLALNATETKSKQHSALCMLIGCSAQPCSARDSL